MRSKTPCTTRRRRSMLRQAGWTRRRTCAGATSRPCSSSVSACWQRASAVACSAASCARSSSCAGGSASTLVRGVPVRGEVVPLGCEWLTRSSHADNIATPVASALGDMVTLVILGGLSSLFIIFMGALRPGLPLPGLARAADAHPGTHRAGTIISTLVFVALLGVIAVNVVLTFRNAYVQELLTIGWGPLFAAMAISRCVSALEPCRLQPLTLLDHAHLQRFRRRPRDLRQRAPGLRARVARRDGPLRRSRLHLGLAHLDRAPLGPEGAVPRRRGDAVRARVPGPRPVPAVPVGDGAGRGDGLVCGRVHGRCRATGACGIGFSRLRREYLQSGLAVRC